MKIAIYPGSFNPWHEGHTDVLHKALKIFDIIVIAVGRNPDKDPGTFGDIKELRYQAVDTVGAEESHRIKVMEFNGSLADFANEYYETDDSSRSYVSHDACAVIRGLRNGQDFEYEKSMQYWNEDLGLNIPTVYLISDRKLTHISSSAIRAVSKLK